MYSSKGATGGCIVAGGEGGIRGAFFLSGKTAGGGGGGGEGGEGRMEGGGGHALTLVVVTLAAVTKIDPWGGHRFSQRANLGAGTVVKLSTGPSLSQHRSEHIKGSKQNKKQQQQKLCFIKAKHNVRILLGNALYQATKRLVNNS